MRQRLLHPLPAILALLLALGGLASPQAAEAQEARSYQITGTVVDAQSLQPLAGVAVSLLGTERGVLTNESGQFSMSVDLAPGSYELRFRVIGRRDVVRELELGTRTSVDLGQITMEATAVTLDELVVTGTGAPTTRRTVGNTIETISGEEINESVGARSVDVALQGKVAGAVINSITGQAGSGTTVRLRGTSTILGNAEPLYVIDGVIVDNSSNALVSVSGNEGRQGANVNTRISDIVPGEIERIEVLKGAAAAALYGSRAASGVIQIFTKEGGQGLEVRLSQQFSVSEAPDRYDLVDLPRAGFADVIFGPADSIGQPIERFDFQDEIFRSPLASNTQLSVSGGDAEGTAFHLSGSFRHEPGIVASNTSQVKNGSLNLSRDIGTDLRLSGSVRYVQADNEFLKEGEQVDGALTNIIFNPTSNDFRFDEELGRYPFSPVLGPNPLQVIREFDANEDSRRFLGSLQAAWSPLDRLSLRYVVGIDDGRQSVRGFQPPRSFAPSFTGLVEHSVRSSQQVNNDLTLTYDQPLTDALTLQTNAGFRGTIEEVDVTVAAAEDLPPDQELVGGATPIAAQSRTEVRTLEFWLQERLNFNDRLYVNARANIEGNSSFGEDERWTVYPGGGLSWVVSDEPFWDVGFLSQFRLRAAYGEAGGRGTNPFAQFNNFVANPFSGRPGLVGSGLAGNPELGPERQKEIEAGFEAGLFGDRASLEFTWYDRTTEDLVLSVPLPPSTGFQSQFRNVGELKDRGFEMTLETVNVDRQDLRWTTRLQLARNQNEVQTLRTPGDTLTFGFGGSFSNAVVEGHPVGAFYGNFTATDEDGNPVIDEATGLPVRAREDGVLQNRILGDPEPDFTASLQSSVRVDNRLTVDFLLDGRFGNDVANLTRRIQEFFGTAEVVEDEIERAIAMKDDPSLQPLQYSLNGELIGNFGRYIEDGTFVKLRELSVRYDLGSAVARTLGARSASVRLAARNLFTLTDYSGLDPEVSTFGASTVSRGLDFANTPIPRSYVLGIDVRF
jgi:TonB-linked SusC/RagA family outer membrane protein